MIATNSTHSGGATGSSLSVTRGANVLSSIPHATGNSTTRRVPVKSSQPSNGTAAPVSLAARSGVITLASTVEHAVMATLSATSALAISVTRFEAVPPGQHPTRIVPAANLWGGGVGRASVCFAR